MEVSESETKNADTAMSFGFNVTLNRSSYFNNALAQLKLFKVCINTLITELKLTDSYYLSFN